MITLIKTKLHSRTHLLIFIYAILYILFVGRSILNGQYSINIEGIAFYLLFLLFLSAFIFSFFIEFISGILLLTWNFGIWISVLFIDSYAHLAGIITGIPLIILGTFFVLRGIETKNGIKSTTNQKWRTVISILTITFSTLYFLVIFEDVISSRQSSYFKMPGIYLVQLAALYAIGFILSWKHELYAGIIFILWYIGVFLLLRSSLFISNYEIWSFAGSVVFINGYFLLRYGYDKMRRNRV